MYSNLSPSLVTRIISRIFAAGLLLLVVYPDSNVCAVDLNQVKRANEYTEQYFPSFWQREAPANFRDRIPEDVREREEWLRKMDFQAQPAQTNFTFSGVGYREDWKLVPDFGLGPADDNAVAMVSDARDNLYICGYSSTTGYDLDIFTLKYAPTGQLIWSAIYNGPANNDDQAVNILLNSDGFVYVAGRSVDASGQRGIVLIKYNSNGIQLWDKFYMDLGDELKEAKLSPDQNIILGAEAGTDLQTSKLDSAGQVLWTELYPSNSSSGNYYHDLETDKDGNVYLTGFVRNGGHSSILGTFKYNSDGRFIWESLIAVDQDGYLYANQLLLDANQNVYLCGTGRNYENMQITKIDSSGLLVWAHQYDAGLYAVSQNCSAVWDSNGYIYLLGVYRAFQEWAGVLVKYDRDGQQIWDHQFDDTYDNIHTSLTLDKAGNIISAGYIQKSERLFFVNKIDSAGQELGSMEYLNPDNNWVWPLALVCRSDDQFYLLANRNSIDTGDDFSLLQLDAALSRIWEIFYHSGSASSNFYGGDLARDDQGNVYVLAANAGQLHLLKYNQSGALVWQKVYPESPPISVYPYTLEFSATEQALYLMAKVAGDLMLFKYLTSGELEWNQIVESYFKMSPVNDQGGVAMAGVSTDVQTGYEIVRTNSYDRDGNLTWTNEYLQNEFGYLNLEEIVVAGNGNVYILIEDWKEQSSYSQYRLIAYDQSGVQRWSKLVIDPTYSYFSELILDDWDNLYVVGQVHDSLSRRDSYQLKKITQSGKTDWIAVYDNPDLDVSRGFTTTYDLFGNIYLAGSSWNYALGEYTFLILKWDRYGELQWERFIDESMGHFFPIRLETDQLGNLYVCGSSRNISGNIDVITLKFDIQGDLKWLAHSGNDLYGWDWFEDMVIDKRGNVYITADSYSPFYRQNFVSLFKYGQTAEDSLEYVPLGQFSLAQNAPNPFNNQTLIRFSLQTESTVKLSVFSSSGQRVHQANMGRLTSGEHHYHFDGSLLASGVYFYRIEAGKRIKTKKMVLVH